MPSLLDRCPICGTPGPAGEPCSTPACRQQGARFAPPKEPSGPDGIVFDLGSLQAQFADIPDPENEQLSRPPPPPRKPKPPDPAPPPAPPAQDDSWAANWKPPPPRAAVERTLLVEPIRDADGNIGIPRQKRKSSGLLMVVMVIASLGLLGAVIWLMLNPPAPSQKKKPAPPPPAAPADPTPAPPG